MEILNYLVFQPNSNFSRFSFSKKAKKKQKQKNKQTNQNKRAYFSLHIQCRQQMINCLLMRIQINAADAQIITTPYEAWTEI